TKTRAAAALILAAVLAAYSGSLSGPFVFDDVPAITQNPTLRHPGEVWGLLLPPGDQAGTIGGRPVLSLSLAANFAAGGTKVLGYHTLNVAIHAVAALLLFGVVLRTLGICRMGGQERGLDPPWPASGDLIVAFLTALLWAVHPLQTESVTYVVQRAESLMGLFYLLTIYSFAKYSAGPSYWGGLCVAACALGMGTKEVMVSAPVVIFLYDRAFVSGSWREALRRHRGLYVGLASTWVLLAYLVAESHGRGGSAGFGGSASAGSYFLTQCRAVEGYLRQALLPVDLVFDRGTSLVHNPGDVAGSIVLLSALFAGTVYGLFRNHWVGFVGMSFFLILAPTSSFLPIATEPVAEHRMYLPLALISILAVTAAYAAMARVQPRRAALVLCATGCAAAAALGAGTRARNTDYRSEVALWTDTAAKAPGNPRAHNNLAEALLSAGEPVKAAAEFAESVKVDPDYLPAHYNLGVILLDSGDPGAAIGHLEKAQAAPRHQRELHLYLAEAYERVGRHAESAGQYKQAMVLDPGSAQAAFGLGNNLAALGHYPEAVEALRAASTLEPNSVNIRNNLANALWLAGKRADAVSEYREALKLDPDSASIRENLRGAEGAMGR
ncbi:MAG TPA: tetratricopeptide repeat protein, partial [Opitutaceae bacterium]